MDRFSVTEVKIKGEMPKRCIDCDFRIVADPIWCFMTGEDIEPQTDPYINRPAWCPLIAIGEGVERNDKN